MLWSRCHLPRSVCASRYKQSTSRVHLYFNSIQLPEPPTPSRDAKTLFRVWQPVRTDRTRIGIMPPKQATLGYVQPSQQTLGCGFRIPSTFINYSRLLTTTKQVLWEPEWDQSDATAGEAQVLLKDGRVSEGGR